jgi:hypothetical protein
MARLALMGQTIDVSAPSTLQPGNSISVAVVRDGANLKLVMQQEAQAAPQQAPVASAPALKADPVAFLPATVKAAIIGALLDSLNTGTPSAERTGSPPQSPSSPATPAAGAPAASPAGAAAAPGAGPQATAQTQHDVGRASQAPGPVNDPQQASPSVTSSTPTAPQTAGLPGDATSVAAQNSAPAILVPFHLPQLAQPLMLRVEQHKEDGADDSGGPAAKRAWTVSVSLDAGALGLIHAGIGIRQGEVSVRFSAKDQQGAAHLSAWLPELRKSLEQADFAAGELSAAVALQAEPDAGQGRSYTV